MDNGLPGITVIDPQEMGIMNFLLIFYKKTQIYNLHVLTQLKCKLELLEHYNPLLLPVNYFKIINYLKDLTA